MGCLVYDQSTNKFAVRKHKRLISHPFSPLLVSRTVSFVVTRSERDNAGGRIKRCGTRQLLRRGLAGERKTSCRSSGRLSAQETRTLTVR